MIGLEDRQALARDIDVAHTTGAQLKPACKVAGIDLRTLQRWHAAGGLVSGDRQPQAVRPVPGHALSKAERAHLLAMANEPRFAAVPPARIVPMLVTDEANDATNFAKTDWVLVSRSAAVLAHPRITQAVDPIEEIPGLQVWTDSFNNLFTILK